MEKTSVRLPPETLRKLAAEARKSGEVCGVPVTVSDLIRACIQEKFPAVSAQTRRENTLLTELKEEILRLREGSETLARDVEKLVKKLSELVPQLATREQVDELTDGLVATIKVLKGR